LHLFYYLLTLYERNYLFNNLGIGDKFFDDSLYGHYLLYVTLDLPRFLDYVVGYLLALDVLCDRHNFLYYFLDLDYFWYFFDDGNYLFNYYWDFYYLLYYLFNGYYFLFNHHLNYLFLHWYDMFRSWYLDNC
jgi:hypothetical protein